MSQLKDMVGIVTGRLTVIRASGKMNGGAVKWLCRCECGNLTVVSGANLRKQRTKSCGCWNKEVASKTHSGDKSNTWRGGKIITNGYVYVLSKGHPHTNNKGYVLEHRLVVEKMLGRYLTNKEEVHHINGNRQDNNLFNLWIFPTRSEHVRYHRRLDTGKVKHPARYKAIEFAEGVK
jgi:uncharacterized protein (DUF1330 family)